jgi:hypothetical protein
MRFANQRQFGLSHSQSRRNRVVVAAAPAHAQRLGSLVHIEPGSDHRRRGGPLFRFRAQLDFVENTKHKEITVEATNDAAMTA